MGVTKRIPAHRAAMVEAFILAMEGRVQPAKSRLKEAKVLTDKFYAKIK